MTKPHRFNPTVLREYDIRGIVGEEHRQGRRLCRSGRGFGSAVVRRNGGKTGLRRL